MKMTELAPGILASPCVPPACCRKAVQMVILFRQGRTRLASAEP
ncbi:Uncharacterised protein [Salmonella enterica subsp. enterica serovar Typhi]|nr:Uncharacterised protein [Salmonella enterica subsp. enterica serovar Typhi]